MTTHEQALRALAQAYDREDAAQRGEPDPWNLDDPGDIGDSDTWVSERLACAQVAAEAFLSALLPEDVAGLVERLQERATVMEHLSPDFASVCREAASLIQSQAARIAELEAVTADLAMDLEAELNARYGMDPVHPAEARRKERDMEPVLRARALLNKDPSHD